MARPSSPIIEHGQYLAARLASMFVTMFEVDANLRTAAALGRAMWALDRRHRERTRAHMRLAFSQFSPERIDELGIQSFEHFMKLIVEVCHTPQAINRDNWSQRAVLNGLAPAVRYLNAGKPVILVTGHVGNWEVLGYLLAVLGYHCAAIARPLDNRLINDWVLGVRQRRGMRIITKWDATDSMMQVLDEGGALGFIADQNAGDKGLFVPFFGKLASTYKSIGLLAIDRNVPVVCGYAHRVGPGYRYELGLTDVIEPQDWADRADPLYYVTARYMRAIEAMVRRRPEQYLWMHRRWKSRPRHERQGKPMPAALRAKLEELPWMDAATLESVGKPM